MKPISPAAIIYLACHLILFLIGFLFVLVDYVVAQGVGASLIAASVTGWVIFVYLRFTESVRGSVEAVTELGIRRGFHRRGPAIKAQYDSLLANAKSHIDIMGFGLRALREDYIDDFQIWQSRATVRILLLQPHHPPMKSHASQRDVEENNPTGTIENDVRKFLEDTAAYMSDRFRIRLYTCLPSINIFRVDNQLFWGPYLIGKQSRNMPTLLIQRPGLLFDPVLAHFNTIWESYSIGVDEWVQRH